KLLDKEGPVPAESFMVRARLDRIQLQLRNTEDDVDFIWLDGWGFVRGCDNRRFEKSLVLENNGEVRRYELFSTYRKDILNAFRGEDHIELSGFFFRLPVSELEGKEWHAGIVMTDIITGKELYRDLAKNVKA
ncbi:MAG: hypothetical protein K5669_09420, partial [Lachnospiraceae bacterium]|nr:hypothetical protein [Lachnospiraceae bacterium]